MKTAHIGTYHFNGDMPAIANFVGEMYWEKVVNMMEVN
jgi:hypothetical protein